MHKWQVKLPTREGAAVLELTPSAFRCEQDESVQANSYNLAHLGLAWISLIADSPIASTYVKPRAAYTRFLTAYRRDPRGLIRSYSDLADKLLRALSDDTQSIECCFEDFMALPIFKEFHEFYKTSDPSLLQFISTFLMFGKKSYYDDPELEAATFRKWHEVEARLASVPQQDDVLGALKLILRKAFENYRFHVVPLPKHGSGSVAEHGVRDVVAKNQSLRYDARVDHIFFRNGLTGYDPARVLPDGQDWRGPKSLYGESIEAVVAVSTRKSELITVAKNIKSRRTICKEPASLMYGQQAVRLDLEEWIASGAFKPYVRIRDQGFNRDGAQYGSEHRLVDTIDLSSASDSVAWSLVRSIFPPSVLKYLHATRSTIVATDRGDVVPLKFAPMGSALCFPVQTIVYTAVNILAAYLWWRGSSDEPINDLIARLPFERLFQKEYIGSSQRLHAPRVYGDDIICDARVTSIVIELLHLLGFQVNTEKSFVGDHPYRESCGGHFYRGEDVTPLLFHKRQIKKRLSPDALASIIKLANQAVEYGFRYLRRFLLRTVLFYPLNRVMQVSAVRGTRGKMINPVAFTNDPDISSSLLTTGAVLNLHLRTRKINPELVANGFAWERFLEAYPEEAARYVQHRGMRVVPQRKKQVPEEYRNYAYVLWQRSKRYGDTTTAFSSGSPKRIASGKRFGWGWTPS